MDLYRSSPSGAAIPYDNSHVGEFEAGQQYLHLRAVDWNRVLNVVEADHFSHMWGAPVLLTLSGALYVAIGTDLCATVAGCVVGVELGYLPAAASFGAAGFLYKGAWEYTRFWWGEASTYTPCKRG
jgi:hypothetical protein